MRSLEKIRPRISDLSHRLSRYQTRIGVLYHIIGFDADDTLVVKPRPQGRLVGQNVRRKPNRPFVRWMHAEFSRLAAYYIIYFFWSYHWMLALTTLAANCLKILTKPHIFVTLASRFAPRMY